MDRSYRSSVEPREDPPRPAPPEIPQRPEQPSEPGPREWPQPDETPLTPGAPERPEPVAPPEVEPPREAGARC
jgi:hypothetical protein